MSDSELPPLDESILADRRLLAHDNVKRAYDSSLSLVKWVLTSTTTLHSAALIAIFNSERFSEALVSGPAWFFLAGVGLSVASGLAFVFASADFAGRMAASLWNNEGINQPTMDTYDPDPTKSVVFASSLLGLSVAAFLLGVGYSGFEISKLDGQAVAKDMPATREIEQ